MPRAKPRSPKKRISSGRKPWSRTMPDTALVVVALAALTLFTFWPVTSCKFVNYDDYDYVTDNPHVQQGLTPRSVAWAFTTGHAYNWHPLTWLSLMLEYDMYKLDPAGY